MKNKVKLILIVMFLLITVSIIIPMQSYCVDDIITQMSGATDLTTSNKITDGIDRILSLVRYVGSGLSIVVVLWLAIKYMIASIEDKVEIKKRAMPVFIGCIIIFATTNLLKIIYDIVKNF